MPSSRPIARSARASTSRARRRPSCWKAREITLFADSDFQISQVTDILRARLAKRGVDLRYLDTSAKIEKIGGDKVRQAVTVKSGVPSDVAKKIQSLVKQKSSSCSRPSRGDSDVRVSGAKRDDLQAAIALLRRELADVAADLRELPATERRRAMTCLCIPSSAPAAGAATRGRTRVAGMTARFRVALHGFSAFERARRKLLPETPGRACRPTRRWSGSTTATSSSPMPVTRHPRTA